jgi:hypothetical protein
MFLAGVGLGATRSAEAPPDDRQRIHSTLGFSLLPPPGKEWSATVSGNLIEFHKKTDPEKVSFFAQTVLANGVPRFASTQALIAFVQKTKEEWGDDGRFAHLSSTFSAEAGHAGCVRYRMVTRDHGARNLGAHPYLLLHVVGRFCTHPQYPQAAADMTYSIRHIPGYDIVALEAEGEAFLDSLVREPLPPDPGALLDAAAEYATSSELARLSRPSTAYR